MNYVIKDKRSDVYITRTRHGGYRIGTAGEAKTWKTESGANAALDLIASVTSAGASTLHVIPEPEVVAIAKERVAQVEALRRLRLRGPHDGRPDDAGLDVPDEHGVRVAHRHRRAAVGRAERSALDRFDAADELPARAGRPRQCRLISPPVPPRRP